MIFFPTSVRGAVNNKSEQRDQNGVLDARLAGAFLRAKLGDLQIQQLAERTTVPDPDYLSNLLSGRVNIGRSRHFPSIARALNLTRAEIEYINPNLFVVLGNESESKQEPSGPPPQLQPELEQMLNTYAPIDPELKDPAWRRFLASLPMTAQNTARDWYELFLKLKGMGLNPDKAC